MKINNCDNRLVILNIEQKSQKPAAFLSKKLQAQKHIFNIIKRMKL